MEWIGWGATLCLLYKINLISAAAARHRFLPSSSASSRFPAHPPSHFSRKHLFSILRLHISPLRRFLNTSCTPIRKSSALFTTSVINHCQGAAPSQAQRQPRADPFVKPAPEATLDCVRGGQAVSAATRMKEGAMQIAG